MKKVFLAGAVASAVALTAMSAAWACTGQSGVLTDVAVGDPSEPVVVRGTGFATGVVQIRWDSTSGPVLATVNGPSFAQTVAVPADAKPRIHYIVAVQRSTTGSILSQSTVPYEVVGATTPPPPPVPGPIEPPAPGPAPVLIPAPGVVPSPAPERAPTRQPVVVGQPVTATPNVVAPGAVTPAPVAGAPAAAIQPVAGIAGASAAVVPSLVPAEIAAAESATAEKTAPADVRDLWSGLEPGRDLGASLTAPQTGPSDSARLALGLLALSTFGLLAGAALELRSRRRALVPATGATDQSSESAASKQG